MRRAQGTVRFSPLSGKISPKATLNPLSSPQIYRIYNTSDALCPVGTLNVSEGCSLDIAVNSTTVVLGAADVEAVYEMLTTNGLRSGRFNKPGMTNRTIISAIGVGSIYRFFNTRKTGNVAVTVGAVPHTIAKGCSKDLFVPFDATVSVNANDRGVYDFLAFCSAGASVDSAVRQGNFVGAQTIASLVGNPQKVVYRISNSGAKDILYTGMTAGMPIEPGCSCDVEVPAAGSLALSPSVTGQEIEGSYELLLVH